MSLSIIAVVANILMEIVKILIILLFGFLLKNIFNLILNLKIILIIDHKKYI